MALFKPYILPAPPPLSIDHLIPSPKTKLATIIPSAPSQSSITTIQSAIHNSIKVGVDWQLSKTMKYEVITLRTFFEIREWKRCAEDNGWVGFF